MAIHNIGLHWWSATDAGIFRIGSLLGQAAFMAGFVVLSSCGGGSHKATVSDPVNPNAWVSGRFNDASIYENKCAMPRTGIDKTTGHLYPDKQGTTLDENNFLRSWSDNTYLWYGEIRDKDPSLFADPIAYFAQLKTTNTTASGKEKDHFHFTYASADWYNTSQAGVSAGYGMEFSWINNRAPRNVVVAYTEVGSPAALHNVKRGEKLIAVDGIDFINSAEVDKLNAGLFPTALNEAHTFEFQDVNSLETHQVVLQSASVTKTPVQQVKVIDTSTGKVGYFLFNEHIVTAERGLYDAINQLRSQGVKDLVLDLRYNGGGFLDIASELAYMIAGDTATRGKYFEKTTFNDKHQTRDIFGSPITSTPFISSNSSLGALPALNLSNVYVITTGDTCSASESIINGLRGVGVKVIQIGSKTCGKPYGFYPQDNCGTTYFSIQFKGENFKQFGEYSDGFVPSDTDNDMDNIQGCALGDDLTHDLGDSAEKNLAEALHFREVGSCTPIVSVGLPKVQKASGVDYSNTRGSINREPGLMNRILDKPH